MSIGHTFLPPYVLQKVSNHYFAKMNEEEADAKKTAAATAAAATASADSEGDFKVQDASKMTYREKYQCQQTTIRAVFARMATHNQLAKEAAESAVSAATHAKKPAQMKVFEMNGTDDPVEKKASDGGDYRTCFEYMTAINDLYTGTLGSNVFAGRYPQNTMRIFLNSPSNAAFNNAYWTPESHSVYYGFTDPKLFNPFIKHLDIASHEFSHGFTEYTSNLEYEGQSGALNESISDVFGETVAQKKANQRADEADWLVADGLIVKYQSSQGTALRSLKAPGTAYRNHPILGDDPQPADMDHFDPTTEDNGGVHINSGIPNKAYYLVATSIQGNSWDKPIKIWHASALKTSSNASFFEFARTTIAESKLLFGANVENLVSKAWFDVGVLNAANMAMITGKSIPKGTSASDSSTTESPLYTHRYKIMVGVAAAASLFAIGYFATQKQEPVSVKASSK